MATIREAEARVEGAVMGREAQDGAIGAIRERWQLVTPGPWRIAPDGAYNAVRGNGGKTFVASVEGEDDEEAIVHAPEDIATLLNVIDRQAALVALAHELAELEHGARGQQMQALHRLGIVVTLDAHLARARAFADKQHARIDALAGSPASGGLAGEEGNA